MIELQNPPFNNFNGGYGGRQITTLPFNNYFLMLAQQARINLSADLAEAPTFIEVIQNGENFKACTGGNFSLVIGKPKSRKTFFTTALLSAALKNGNVLGLIKGQLPENQRVVISFDTEQANYHVQKAAKRVLGLAELPFANHFLVYGLRKYAVAERLGIIENIIYSTPNLGFVVIDGIRDLISSINDEEQATMLVGKLLKWTEELNIHIVCVLHQNKNDPNARGHVGTEAQNKAEIVISVTKNSREASTAAVVVSREKEFKPFTFGINQEGLPVLVENWKSASVGKTLKKHQPEFSDKIYGEIIKKMFSEGQRLMYSQLTERLKELSEEKYIFLSQKKIRELIQYLLENDLISTTGQAGTRNCFYFLSLPS